MRVYWSEIANPETLLEPPVRVSAEQKFRQVLKDVVIRTTAIAFPFPAVVADLEAIDSLVVEHREYYVSAFERLADTVEYQLTATWADEQSSDLATPVSGREYLKRRQESESRIAAIDTKLKSVTGWHRARLAVAAGPPQARLVRVGSARRSGKIYRGIAQRRAVGRGTPAPRWAVAPE